MQFHLRIENKLAKLILSTQHPIPLEPQKLYFHFKGPKLAGIKRTWNPTPFSSRHWCTTDFVPGVPEIRRQNGRTAILVFFISLGQGKRERKKAPDLSFTPIAFLLCKEGEFDTKNRTVKCGKWLFLASWTRVCIATTLRLIFRIEQDPFQIVLLRCSMRSCQSC